MDVLGRNNVHVTGDATGRPMVFAHGLGCDQDMWRHVAPRFEADHRVVLFDHVGAGAADPSAWSRERYSSLQAYAEDLLEIVHDLDLHDVVLVGHSVSAMIGVLAAVAEPERFGALVLVCPSPRYVDEHDYRGGFSREDVAELLAAMDDNYLGWVADLAPVIMANGDRPALGDELSDSFCRTDPEMARAFARVTFLSDSREALPLVTVPTLVLQCTDDAIAPVEVGEYVRDRVPGSELVLLDATGHCPNLSAPEATTAAIRAFVSPGERSR